MAEEEDLSLSTLMKDKSLGRGRGFVLKNPDERQISRQRKKICP